MSRFLLIAAAVLSVSISSSAPVKPPPPPPPENVLPDARAAMTPQELAAVTEAHAMISATMPQACGCSSAPEPIDVMVLAALLVLRSLSDRIFPRHDH